MSDANHISDAAFARDPMIVDNSVAVEVLQYLLAANLACHDLNSRSTRAQIAPRRTTHAGCQLRHLVLGPGFKFAPLTLTRHEQALHMPKCRI